MKFMILVKSNPDLEARLATMNDEQIKDQKDQMAAMEVFNEELRKAGVMKDCDGLRPSREGDKRWYEERLPLVDDHVRKRLDELANRLGETDWLDGYFSAGDLMMAMVLRRLERGPLLEEFPNLLAYVARGEARPAFTRAFEAQRAVFAASSTK